MSQTAEEFRNEQKDLARQQGLTSENAVPEQRPIASQQVDPATESETYKRLKESGDLQEEPMPKSAYDKADSNAQAKKAEKAERPVPASIGDRILITKGPYKDNYAVINEIEYKDEREVAKAAAGTPESRFAKVAFYRTRTRGGRHALVNVKPGEFRLIGAGELGNRGEA